VELPDQSSATSREEFTTSGKGVQGSWMSLAYGIEVESQMYITTQT